MLSVAHGTTGAFIASKIHNPIISIPLIILSHYIEDYIPHWDIGQGLTHRHKSKKIAFTQELLIDFPLSIVIVFFFFQLNQPPNPSIWIGWFFGLLPDFIEFPRLFLEKKFTPLKQLSSFHKRFHRSIPNKLTGLLPQIILLILIYIFK